VAGPRSRLKTVIRRVGREGPHRGDCVETLSLAKVASEFWSTTPSDDPRANGVSKIRRAREDILAIRRFWAGCRLFQHDPDKAVIHANQFWPTCVAHVHAFRSFMALLSAEVCCYLHQRSHSRNTTRIAQL